MKYFDFDGCEVYFTRHAQSMANIGHDSIDSPLSVNGIDQARRLSGHYDLVICSPLRRTKETLHYSSITWDKLIITPNCREFVGGESSRMLFEPNFKETEKGFWERAKKFTYELEDYCEKLPDGSKVLIVSHGYFFNGWYRGGCFNAPMNASIFQLAEKVE